MFALTVQKRTWTIAILGIVMLFGAYLRLYDLDKQTIGHIEVYTPGIRLPAGLADPSPRLNLSDTLIGLLVFQEPHPPGYYVLMLGWTKLFGDSVIALRLPSALFGIASILLIYVVSHYEGDNSLTSLLAAGMLAFNGLHIFWSQISKMYALGCLLGLLSTVLLLRLLKGGAWPRLFLWMYIGVTLAGLATVVFFWLIFFTHMLWVLLRSINKPVMPALFNWQTVIWILGSPLWALVIFQSRRSSYMDENLFAGVSHFLQLGFLFEPEEWLANAYTIPAAATITLIILTLFLGVIGFTAKRNEASKAAFITQPPYWSVVLAGVAAVLVILKFAQYSKPVDPSRNSSVVAASVLPAFLVLLYFLLQRNWEHIQIVETILAEKSRWLNSFSSLNSLLLIFPTMLTVAVSLFIPLFASRTMLLFVPYLLIVVSRGAVSLIHHNRRWIIILLVLAVIHAYSVNHYKHRLFHPTDYKGLAEKWTPVIQRSDLIFVQYDWATTPIFYYLDANRYYFVNQGYSQKISQNPDSRVWVLTFEVSVPQAIKEVLIGYKPVKSVEALGIKAELFDRP